MTLEVREVDIAYGDLKVLSKVSLRAEPGRIVSLIGPNGAGKTSLFNVISGSMRPAAGQVTLDGRRVSGRGAFRAARAGIARTWQVARPFPELTVLDNVVIALGHAAYYHPLTALRHAATKGNRRRAAELLESTGLPPPYDRMAGELPIGHLRLLEVARALATDPTAILLDEPAAGLRSGEVEHLELLLGTLREQGFIVLLVEHNVPLALRVADLVVVLAHQRRLAEGSPDDIRKNPQVIDAYLGPGHVASN